MANSVMDHGDNFIQKQKKKKQWMIAFICVAVVAVSGTVAALVINGQALNHTKKVLNCKLEVHQHDEQCYSQAEGEEDVLVCGFADYVVHVHNDDCYGEDGELVCQLPEIEPHKHTEECYKEEKFLICDQEEVEPHKHTESCYEMRPVEAAAEEPGAGEGTEAAEGTQAGEDSQAAEPEMEPVLTCTLEETEGHIHGEECYETRKILACGKLELHTHDEKLCYEEVETVDEDGNPITVKNLICDIPVLYEHVHGEDCFEVVELSGEEVGKLNEANKDKQPAEEDQQPGQDEDDPAENVKDPQEGAADTAEAGEGTEPEEGQEAAEKPFHKVYEDETIKVTASYDEDAQIPEEAELRVEPAAEEPEADPTETEAVQALLGEEEPSAKMAYTIGFFVGEEEIEPQGMVTITIQLPEGQEIAPGAPVTVIHYGDNGPEALQGKNVVKEPDGKYSISFDSSAFSKFMIVIGEPTEEPGGEENPDASNGENGENPDGEEEEPKTETVSYKLQDSFLYENDDFGLTLRVVGTATAEMPVEKKPAGTQGTVDRDADTQEPGTAASVDTAELEGQETVDTEGTENQEDGAQETVDDEAGPGEAQDNAEGNEADTTQKPEADETGDTASDTPGDGAEADQTEDQIQQLTANDVEMELQFLEQEDETYQEIEEFARKESKNGNLLDLSVMHYTFTYEGVPLDISGCEVRAEVALKEKAIPADSDEADTETEAGEAAEDSSEAQEEEGEASAGEPTIGEGDSGEEPVAGETDTEKDTMAENSAVGEKAVVVSLIVANEDGYGTADSKDLTPDRSSLPVLTGENLQNNVATIAYSEVEGPSYTVQYYAWLDEVQYGETGLQIIDTTGGILPQNGVTPKVKNMVLKKNGGIYTPKTEKVLKQIFEVKEPYQFYISQNLENVDILYESDSYTLKELWVLKDGKKPESTDEADWLRYENPREVKFTYNDSAVSDPAANTIKIETNKTVLRLVYDPKKSSYNNAALFYDYDISDGYIYQNENDAKNRTNLKETSKQDGNTWYANTLKQGINSDSNYQGNGAKLAFGNNNTGTGFGEEKWGTNTLNKANRKEDGNGYMNCTFGIPSSLSDNGKIQYSAGIIAPNLFNDGAANGKSTINNWSLNFNRVGDTYTLKSVEGGGIYADNLDQFKNTGVSYSTKLPLYSNMFWPMDGAGTFGADGHDLYFGATNLEANRKFVGQKTGTFPVTDGNDGDHNAYFGMQYAITFNYTDTYRGPLEYCFFGDDDMWVFLDGRLICDIGGVHASVGEYVNLWDYLTPEMAGEHTLQVFYTERGASGSTCYMQFTLPSVSSAPLDTETGLLNVEKQVDGPSDAGIAYEFTLQIDTQNMYPYRIIAVDGRVKSSGDIKGNQPFEFSLGNKEHIEVNYLPVGTAYTVTEKEGTAYTTTVSVGGADETATNTITNTITSSNNKVVYINHTSYELPKTGSSGAIKYTFGGIAVVAAGLMYGYQWKRRRERRNQN